MKKVAIYPGSFNPYHSGHEDIVRQTLRVFDKVIIAMGQNPEKGEAQEKEFKRITALCGYGIKNGCVEVIKFEGLLADFVRERNKTNYEIHAVVRGLRNTSDFEFEKIQTYWNEDLRIGIPTMFFMADRKLVHISSTAVKAVSKFGRRIE